MRVRLPAQIHAGGRLFLRREHGIPRGNSLESFDAAATELSVERLAPFLGRVDDS